MESNTSPLADSLTDAHPHSLRELRIGGTEVHYYVLCPRKLWWFAHGMEQEHAGGATATAGQENVALGTLLHQESYTERSRKEILLDDLLRLDFSEGGAIQEVKKSKGGSRAYRATRYQLLYYLYYLKHEKGIETEGVIEYPKQRRRETVLLTPEEETTVSEMLIELDTVRKRPTPPAVPEPMTLCKRCSYQDLCWG